MSSNDSDKTVFRPSPGGRRDSTVIRPSPGGRGGSNQTQVPGARSSGNSVPSSSSPATNYSPARSQSAPQYKPVDQYMGGQFKATDGLNPLVNAAGMLIAVMSKIQQSMNHPNIGGLHQQMTNEIRKFETQAKEKGITSEILIAARYVLCASLDETVLCTPWGAESAWTQRTLLSVFHNETHGGEKFFQILDRMKDRPADNLYMLELMYLLLSLGFEGKYRVVNRGKEKVEQIRDELFRQIRNQRGEFERTLSPSGAGLGKIRNTLAQYVPLWVIASVVAGILILGYSGFRYWLYHSSTQVVQQLNELAQPETKPAANQTNQK